MAFKKYSYYNKGNKLAIVESDTYSTGGNLAVAHCTLGGYTTKDTCEAAGGQWIPSSSSISNDTVEKYVSPKETIKDGLEIEYSYSPWYNFNSETSGSIIDDNLFRFLGYASDGENLVLITFGGSSVVDLSSKFSPGDYVYIDKGLFAGIHQLSDNTIASEGGAYGVLTTKTKFNPQDAVLTKLRDTSDSDSNTQIGFSSSEVVTFGSTFRSTVNDYRTSFLNNSSVDNYIYVHNHPGDGAADIATTNTGFWSLNNSHTTANELKVVNKYTLSNGVVVETAGGMTNDTSNNGWVMYRAFKRQFNLYKVNVMQDESFKLDLTPYQSQAIVYYLKAKMSEEARDADGREYFMRLFNKQISKAMSSKKKGIHIVQGNGNLL